MSCLRIATRQCADLSQMSQMAKRTSILMTPMIQTSISRFTGTDTVKKKSPPTPSTIEILGTKYPTDSWTSVSPRVLTKINKNLHNLPYHPLGLIRQRIQNYFYSKPFTDRRGYPMFSVYDNLNPVVTTHQNFDSLLIPKSHPSWSNSDTYFLNESHLLRAHTSAHQEELIRAGLDAFLVIGDVYRRDQIDSTHYPVFHQCEGVRLFSERQVFKNVSDATGLRIFESGKRSPDKQAPHTVDAVKLVEYDLKTTLIGLAKRLFGKDIEYRWVECYFPFTHPSWELEIMYQGKWLEVLGCGIVEQQILDTAGASSKVGWAFGLGLERLAMKLYDIPDIRLFWSQDPGFLLQFQVENPETSIQYKPISQFPSCINDISFWIADGFVCNDFFDLARNIGGDLIEQISLIDQFTHPKTQRTSHCYRISYRHMEKTFTQEEVNVIHRSLEQAASEQLGAEIR